MARKKAEALKSEIAKAQNDKKDCSITEAAASIDLKNLGPGLKARRVLKGHFGKVYAMHWAGDNQNLVSASQVREKRERTIDIFESVAGFACRALPVCVCDDGSLAWLLRSATFFVSLLDSLFYHNAVCDFSIFVRVFFLVFDRLFRLCSPPDSDAIFFPSRSFVRAKLPRPTLCSAVHLYLYLVLFCGS